MAEDLNFTAQLIDAMSAPLNAIADALVKVSDSMNAATQVFQDGFDASVKASAALQTSMETLGVQVDAASKSISEASAVTTDQLIPSLNSVDITLGVVDVRLKELSVNLADNTIAVEDNSSALTALDATQTILTQQTNGLATVNLDLANQMTQSTTAILDQTAATDTLAAVQRTATTEVITLTDQTQLLSGEMSLNSAQAAVLTGTLVDQTAATIAQTDATALQTTATTDNTIAQVFSTQAADKNTVATDANTVSQDALKTSVDASAAAYGKAAAAVNTYSNSQRKASQANADANASGKAGEGERAQGYGAILGATMLLGMAGAAVRVGINLVKMGMDGETALTHVAAMTGASADQMTYYKSQIEALAPVAGKTISDLSNGLYDVVSVGYQGAGALNVLKASAYAAAAGGVDLHTVTNGLTGIMKAFAMSSDDAFHATDILIKGVQLGKASFADFSRAVGLVGLVAHEAGFKIDETVAALSTLTQVYPSVRQAGQNLQNLIQNVGINYADVEKRVKAAGVAFDENKFQAEGLKGRLEMLWAASKGNVEEFKKMVGNTTAAKAALALLNNEGKDYTANLQAMSQASAGGGVTMQAFQEHVKTMKAHIEQMSGALSVLAIHIAGIAAPAINAVVKVLTTLFMGLADAIEHHMAIATPVLITLAGVIAGLLVGALVALTGILAPMMGAAFAIATPFIIAGGVIAGFAAFVKHAYDTSQPLRDALHQVAAAAHSLGSTVKQLLLPTIQELGGFIRGVSSHLGDLFGHTEQVSQTFFRWESVTVRVNGHLTTVHHRVEDVRQVLGHVRGPLSFVVDGIRHFAELVHSLTQKLQTLLPHTKNTEHVVSNLANGVSNLHTKFRPLENVIETTTQVVVKHKGILDTLLPILKTVGGVVLSLVAPFGLIGQAFGIIAFLRGPVMLEFVLHLMATFKGLAPLFGFITQMIGIFGRAMALAHTSGQPLNFMLRVLVLTIRGGLMAALSGIASAVMAILPLLLTIIGIIAAVVVVAISVTYAIQHWWKTSAEFHAILKAVVDSLKDLWKTVVSFVHPVIVQLQDTLKSQLLPAWKNIQEAFDHAKPVLLIIAGIIGVILVVAFGILMGVLKGIIAFVGMLLIGIIRFVGGIVQAFSGVILFFASFFGGVAKIFDDFTHGHLERIPKDILNMLGGMAKGIQQLFAGLWNAILGLIVGIGGSIFGFLGGFVSGFLGFFQHIWEHLVGHSIVPDIVRDVVAWIAKLPLLIATELIKLVAKFLGIFGELFTKGTKAAGDLVTGVVGKIGGLVTGGLPHIAKFAGDGLKHLGNLEVQGIQRAVKFAGSVVTNIGQMEANGIKHIGTLAQQGLSIFNGLADQMSGKAQVMKDKVVLEHLAMQVQSLAHVQVMNEKEVGQLEKMRAKILDEMAHTTDGAKKHALAMQLGVVDQSIQMHKNAANEAMHQKNEVLNHMNAMKVQAQKHAQDMNTNVVSQAIIMGQNFVNSVASMATNVLTNVGKLKDNIIKCIQSINLFESGQHIIQTLIDGLKSLMGNLGKTLGDIAKKIGDFLHFGSPTREGEGRSIMEWMPNLVNQLTGDLERGGDKVGTSASKLAASIRKNIVDGTKNSGLGSAMSGPGGSLIGSGNGANGGKQEVHLHLEGGLGAGLQLLDPTSRKRFARQIAEELSRGVGMQGRLDNGYTGF